MQSIREKVTMTCLEKKLCAENKINNMIPYFYVFVPGDGLKRSVKEGLWSVGIKNDTIASSVGLWRMLKVTVQ